MNVRKTAEDLYSTLADHTEDILEDFWIDNYPGGYQKFTDDYMDATSRPAVEAWQELSYRQIMAELAFIVLERSLGRYKGRDVEL